MKLRDLGEQELIDRVTGDLPLDPARVVRGVGDDCSVTRLGNDQYQLVTTDMLVEDVHFLRAAATPTQIGAKAAAVNLSDIAAMGGRPRDAWVSVALPVSLEVAWVDDLFAGIEGALARFDVNLLGGNTTRAERIVVSITVSGDVPRGEVMLRDGARAGDRIFVTGPLGDAAAGLDALRAGRDAAELIRRHHEPQPHIELGRRIASSGHAHAAIDVSDGLALDLERVCNASAVGCLVESARLPLSEELSSYCARYQLDPIGLALGGGEDYVLLVTGDVALEAIPGLVRIGEITAGQRELDRDGARSLLPRSGWDHLRS